MARILIVDDSSTVRKALRLCLSSEGYEVVAAKDGVEALGLALKSRFDAIITDNFMPCMEGTDLVEALRQLIGYQSIPILILSTDAEPSLKEKGRKAGATGWMRKPFNSKTLTTKLQVLLSSDT